MARTVDLQTTILKSLENTFTDILADTVQILAKHFQFDPQEATKLVGGISLQPRETPEPPSAATPPRPTPRTKRTRKNTETGQKPTIPLPWTGIIKQDWCYGLRPLHGLFSQCTNTPAAKDGHGELFGKLCSTCLKQCEQNDHHKPNAGLVTERHLENFTSPAGKKPVPYSKVLEKLHITQQQAIDEANKHGIVIPEEAFLVTPTKRGRPAATTTKTDKADDGATKKRGRPPKTKRTVSVATAEDLLQQLQQQQPPQDPQPQDQPPQSPQPPPPSAKKAPAKKPIAKKGPITPPDTLADKEPDDDDTADEDTDANSDSDEDTADDGDSDASEELDVLPIEINGREYFMREKEIHKDGCDIFDDEGVVVGRFNSKKPNKSIVSS